MADSEIPSIWTSEDIRWFRALDLSGFSDQPGTPPFAKQEDRKWFNGLCLDDFHSVTPRENPIPEGSASPLKVEVEDITARTQAESPGFYEYQAFELLAGGAGFTLIVDKHKVELGFVGGSQVIPFKPEGLHVLLFQELAVLTGNEHLIPPGLEGLKKAEFSYKQKNESRYKTISLSDEYGRSNYFDVMSDPAAVSWIQYNILDSEVGFLYSFHMDSKRSPYENSLVRLGLPRDRVWTEAPTLWAVANHHKAPSLLVVPSMTGIINLKRIDAPSFQ